MCDARNRPAQTQMSHYLRTGRLLPAEYFENHKSSQPAYGGDNFLSHKSWNTIDFWNHYKEASGRTINLVNVGLFREFLNTSSVSNAIEDFQNRQVSLAKQKSIDVCYKLERSEVTKTQVRFSDRKNTVTDVTMNVFRLFSVGKSTFFRSSQCTIEVDCVKRVIQLEGELKYSIDDAFIDARDFGNRTIGNQEFEGGVPFKIVVNWRKPFTWRGKF